MNVPLLVVTVLLLGIAAPALYFWHGASLRGLDDQLVEQATRFEEQKEYARAADYLYRFVQLEPQ